MELILVIPSVRERLSLLRLIFSLMGLVSSLTSCALPAPELRSEPIDYGLSAGSEVSSGQEVRAGADTVTGSGGESNAGSTTEGEWPSLSGYWRVDHRTVLRSELPVLLEEVETTIDAVLIGEVTQAGGSLWLHYRVCDVYMENSPGYNQTLLPDSFLDALPYRARPARLERLESGWALVVPKRYELRGLVMEDPEREPFPSSPIDARIFDQDRDLKPGMSARLVGFPEGEISLIQRSWDRWRAVLDDATSEGESGGRVERVVGSLEWGDEQTIIAASSDVLKIEVTRWIPEEEGLHEFEMRRVSDLACPPRRTPPTPSQ